jgi:2-polyprenyl-6-methoxyphenol hydroxylase-like FAD-dependent oxidoreductase
MHALVLKSHGHSVVVLEMRTEEQLQARAAGLTLWPNAQKLVTKYIPDVELDEIVFRNPSFPIIDKDGNVLVDVPFADDLRTSCWAGIHGLLLMACEREVEGHGPVTIQWGCNVCGVVEHKDQLIVSYKNKDGIGEQITADLVVAADGARSHIRSLVLPDVKTEYVGYLAWRSQFPETEVPEELRGAIEGKMPQCMLDGSYIVV